METEHEPYLLGFLLAAATVRIIHRNVVLHLLRVANLILLGFLLPLTKFLFGELLELTSQETGLKT
jgi:hypothetical protein